MKKNGKRTNFVPPTLLFPVTQKFVILTSGSGSRREVGYTTPRAEERVLEYYKMRLQNKTL